MDRSFRRFFLLLALPVLWLAGCTDSTAPTAVAPTEPTPAFGRGNSGPDLDRIATFKRRPSITIAWAKKWIGPEGGRVELQGFAIDVPAGAVSKVTQFSIRLPVHPQGAERVMAEFGPHGSTFAVPVTIELPFTGTSIEHSERGAIVWWNPDASEWVSVGGTLTEDGSRLQTWTDHFSLYGTSAAFGGTVLMSGG